MKPRHRINPKTVIKIVIGLLAFAAIVFSMFAMMKSGNIGGSQGIKTPGISTTQAEKEEADKEKITEGDNILSDSGEEQKADSTTQNKENVNTSLNTESTEKSENKDPNNTSGESGKISAQNQPEKTTEAGTEFEVTEDSAKGETSSTESTVLSVDTIWNGIQKMLTTTNANMTLNSENLSELYGIDASLCKEFVLKKSGTVISPEEYLIVCAEPNVLSAVEQACQERQAKLIEQWDSKKYPEGNAMVANYKLLISGNYLFFGISENIDQVVGIFQGLTMNI